ncbi:MAG TPA: MmcQ/YjbR family DNA-binding protein [Ilumatobacteraceae bacterium]|nr:MmcQ/YjbR family DNA-binding protein [Ilumatobacteraceae bacterium]
MAPTAKALAKNLERMRAIAMGLPEATEEITWGTDVNFRVRKKIFAFPGDGGSLIVKADRDELPALLADPRFRPAPYLARGGWVVLDLTASTPDWTEVDELIRTSYCLIAPRKLAAQVLGGD